MDIAIVRVFSNTLSVQINCKEEEVDSALKQLKKVEDSLKNLQKIAI